MRRGWDNEQEDRGGSNQVEPESKLGSVQDVTGHWSPEHPTPGLTSPTKR